MRTIGDVELLGRRTRRARKGFHLGRRKQEPLRIAPEDAKGYRPNLNSWLVVITSNWLEPPATKVQKKITYSIY
jgi:hypothetical protein